MWDHGQEYRYLPLGEVVYRKIKLAILGGRLHQGQEINETHFAKELGVSKTPVRESVRRLENEGLLQTMPNKGAFVVTFSLDDVVEIYTMLVPLESLAARFASLNGSQAEANELLILAEKGIQLLETADSDVIHENHLLLHQQIYRMTHAAYLTANLAKLRDYLEVARHAKWEESGGMELTTRAHYDIVRAIIARDADRAAALMSVHIEGALNLLQQQAKNSQQK
jgi:DNA-binding GntR family transcriptional regulator